MTTKTELSNKAETLKTELAKLEAQIDTYGRWPSILAMRFAI